MQHKTSHTNKESAEARVAELEKTIDDIYPKLDRTLDDLTARPGDSHVDTAARRLEEILKQLARA